MSNPLLSSTCSVNNMAEIQRYMVILTLVAALTASGSLLPTVNASFCPPGPRTGIAICSPPPPFNLPVRSWDATINGLPAILNITSASRAGNINGTITGGDLCNGDTQCLIKGTFDGKSGRISFINTASSIEKRVLIGIQNFTGQESIAKIVDIKKYTLAGTGENVKEGPETKIPTTFNWEAHTSCLVIKPC